MGLWDGVGDAGKGEGWTEPGDWECMRICVRLSVFWWVLMGFACCRLTNVTAANAIMDAVRTEVHGDYGYKYSPENVRIITGEEEGAYGWMTANFLSKTLPPVCLLGLLWIFRFFLSMCLVHGRDPTGMDGIIQILHHAFFPTRFSSGSGFVFVRRIGSRRSFDAVVLRAAQCVQLYHHVKALLAGVRPVFAQLFVLWTARSR